MTEKRKSNSKFSQQALLVLRAAAKKPEQWHEAMRDPMAFLKRSGIRLPDGYTVELYEAAFDPKNTTYHENELTYRHKNATSRNFLPSSGGPYIPYQCPAGTRPVETEEETETCIKWGGVSGPLEWVPVEEGSRYGHWERSRMLVCVQWLKVKTKVIKCMPVFEIVKFKQQN